MVKNMLSFLSFLAITNGMNIDCDFVHKGTVCPLIVDNVIAIESESINMSSSENCQYLCFQDHSCKNFTFFANEAGMRCILFRGCQSMMPCNKCVSGPSIPPINQCTK